MIEDLDIPTIPQNECVKSIKTPKLMKNIIHKENDILSFRYRLEKNIQQEVIIDSSSHLFNAYSIEEMYYCNVFLICGIEKQLFTCKRNWREYQKHLDEYYTTTDIKVFNNLVLFLTIRQVLTYKPLINDKLMGTYGQIIISKEDNIPENYCRLLLLYREDIRRKRGQCLSIRPELLNNPLSHVYGSYDDYPQDQYLLVSPIMSISEQPSIIKKVNLKKKMGK